MDFEENVKLGIPEPNRESKIPRNFLIQRMGEIRQQPNGEYTLPSEIKEIIMEKVEDINKPGIGIHGLLNLIQGIELMNRESFEKIYPEFLKTLITGITPSPKRVEFMVKSMIEFLKKKGEKIDIDPQEVEDIYQLPPIELRKKLAEIFKKLRRFINLIPIKWGVYINVIGVNLSPSEIEGVYYNRGLSILIDIDSLIRSGRLVFPENMDKNEILRYGRHIKRMIAAKKPELWKELPYASPAIGYIVSSFPKEGDLTTTLHWAEELEDKSGKEGTLRRIPPRFFKGVVLNLSEVNEADRALVINQIVGTILKAGKDHPDRLLPIYDIKGNLLWPELVSYSKIKSS